MSDKQLTIILSRLKRELQDAYDRTHESLEGTIGVRKKDLLQRDIVVVEELIPIGDVIEHLEDDIKMLEGSQL